MKGQNIYNNPNENVAKKTPVAIFLAATAALATNSGQIGPALAGEENGLGGLKEWTTDQDVDAESKLDDAAKKAKKKVKKNNVCVPI